MKKNNLLGVVLLILTTFSSAQVLSHNSNVWLHYFGKNQITKKVFANLEASYRFTDGFNKTQQWFIRPSVDYTFNKWITGTLGYSHYATYPYGNPALFKTTIPENHIWVQVTLNHQLGDLKFTHRLRDENRFVGIPVADTVNGTINYNIDHYDYRNRFRYYFLATYPLIKKDKATKLSAFIGDEVFLNIGSKSGKTLLNQNRIIAGLGYAINPHHQVQVAYIHQNIWNFSNTIEESNPTLRLSYLTNFSVAKSH